MIFSLSTLALASLISYGSCATQNTVLCGQYETKQTISSHYTFSTNAWGDDGSGSECISIASDFQSFSTTWKWNDNPGNVHAFPNLKLTSSLLPLPLTNLSNVDVKVSWSMTPASAANQTLESIYAGANVVVDMFLDANATKATSTTEPKYEVMVWMGQFGGKTPIGYNTTIKNPITAVVNGTKFKLYSGANSAGQTVYSWLAASNITSFNANVAPLIHALWQKNFIPQSIYLGTFQFGTETFHATDNVTFSASDYYFNILQGTPITIAVSPAPQLGVSKSTLAVAMAFLMIALL